MGKPIVFQATGFVEADKLDERRYDVYIFGKTASGTSVCVRTAFTPYFFIELKGTSIHEVRQKIGSKLFVMNEATGADDEDGKRYVDVTSHLISCELVERKKFMGFTNDEIFKFARLVFSTKRAMRRAVSLAHKEGMNVYESEITPILRLLHVRDIESVGWIEVRDYTALVGYSKETTCKIEVTCSWRVIDRATEPPCPVAPLVIASFDIECASEDGSFPDPKRKGDVVFQIATTFQRFGDAQPYLRHLCNFGECDLLEGVELVCVKSEADLIRRWTDVLRREDADVMVAWNSNGFDYQFIAERASRFGVSVEIGKLLHKESKLITSNLSSAAFGDNKLTYLQTPGIFDLDLMVYVKREYKLDSYRLDAVAEKYLGEHKLDMTPAQIFEAYRGGPADKARCGKYCVSWIVRLCVL